MRNLRQGLFEIPTRSFVSDGLQCAHNSFGPQYSLHRFCVERLISLCMRERLVDIVRLVMFLKPQDVPCVEPAVPGISFYKPDEKLLRGLAQ